MTTEREAQSLVELNDGGNSPASWHAKSLLYCSPVRLATLAVASSRYWSGAVFVCVVWPGAQNTSAQGPPAPPRSSPGTFLPPGTLPAAFEGVHTAYYLIHSMGTARDFERDDRQAATNFAAAAKQAGVHKIIYLGGLGNPEHGLSVHLRSRQENGEMLRASGVQVIEFRVSIIIGSGSLSFELIRALVERLPIMVCPKWVATPAQPIAIEDVLDYFLGGLNLAEGRSRIFQIGGPDRVCYGDIMREYARQRGLTRFATGIVTRCSHESTAGSTWNRAPPLDGFRHPPGLAAETRSPRCSPCVARDYRVC